MRDMNKSPGNGFTLIELMVVVLVAAILAGFAVPSYQNYVLRSGRTDATVALLKLAAAQEKFYLQNGVYAPEQPQTFPGHPIGHGRVSHRHPVDQPQLKHKVEILLQLEEAHVGAVHYLGLAGFAQPQDVGHYLNT